MSPRTLVLLVVATLPALSPATARAAPLAPGDHERTVQVGGLSRGYLVHVPRKLAGKAPVVLAFHGGGSSAAIMRRYSELDATSDREGFVVVYPEGTGRLARAHTWNGGSCCGHAQRRGVDDVAFVRSLLDDLGGALPLDTSRIYATGMSNGGIMAYRLACELSDRIAAIAPVAGSLELAECRPSRPVPVVHFHGTEDAFITYGGGSGPKSVTGTPFASPTDSARRFVELDGCTAKAVRTELPDRLADGTRVIRESWEGCRAGAAVVLYTIDGGGHTWPGHDSRADFLGKTTLEIDVNAIMWEFFEAHPMAPTAGGAAGQKTPQ